MVGDHPHFGSIMGPFTTGCAPIDLSLVLAGRQWVAYVRTWWLDVLEETGLRRAGVLPFLTHFQVVTITSGPGHPLL